MPPSSKKAKKDAPAAAAAAAAAAAEEVDLGGLDAYTPFHPSAVSDQYTDFVARAAYDAAPDEESDEKLPFKLPGSSAAFSFAVTESSKGPWEEVRQKDAAVAAIKDVARAIVLDAQSDASGVAQSEVTGILKSRGVELKYNKCVGCWALLSSLWAPLLTPYHPPHSPLPPPPPQQCALLCQCPAGQRVWL